MRHALLTACLLLTLCATACSDDDETIIISPDCGLIRSDLLGSWEVTFLADTSTLFNCSDPVFNNSTVTVSSNTFFFNDVQVFASAANAGFQFYNLTSPVEIMGNIETDSCNMLFSFLDNEDVYLQCIGVFDRFSGVVQGFCDSTSIPALPISDPPAFVADCDLDPILEVILTIF